MKFLKDLYKDKPLFITVVVGIVLFLYIVWKQKNASLIAPSADTTGTTAPTSGGGVGGTYVEESYYNNTPTSTTTTTYSGNPSSPGIASTPATPVASSTPKKPTTPAAKPTAKPTAKPAPKPATKAAARTVTVTPWPTQNSTLSGIAKSVYGDASKWPSIYNANKAKIGNNPNLIYAGTVLTIP